MFPQAQLGIDLAVVILGFLFKAVFCGRLYMFGSLGEGEAEVQKVSRALIEVVKNYASVGSFLVFKSSICEDSSSTQRWITAYSIESIYYNKDKAIQESMWVFTWDRITPF